jgi:hypothetical protein
MFSFWGGMFGVPHEVRQEFYAALGKQAEAIFPLEVSAEPAICSGVARAEVHGFYKLTGTEIEFER